GRAGRVAQNTEEFARCISELLDDPPVRDMLGHVGREHVRENFLTTRLLEDHLRLMNSLAEPGGFSQNGAKPAGKQGPKAK
ncbi:MAG: glycosyl transferase family 1, partial [Chloroflexi bacterium]|nr:glycosyl transferase family 1 [Chloroflexota bacterium]